MHYLKFAHYYITFVLEICKNDIIRKVKGKLFQKKKLTAVQKEQCAIFTH